MNFLKKKIKIKLFKKKLKTNLLINKKNLLIDKKNKIIYAIICNKNNKKIIKKLAKKINYKPIMFHAYDINHNFVYLIKIIMNIGSNFAIVALDSIPNIKEKNILINQLIKNNKEIIEINLKQMKKISGNILEILSKDKEKKIVMLESAYNSLNYKQIKKLSKYGDLISININNIKITNKGKIYNII
ncbi:arginine deiminase-related protein [Sodalis-like secondary symbiont of Drepanosiphum platanoidis]|uniref:arginine deiminase-related protein n=1 Tax=Sodalis-like secondary symbiont of Drepanosiphum platanoidis TaxID=2994493 RepID=UPI0034643461